MDCFINNTSELLKVPPYLSKRPTLAPSVWGPTKSTASYIHMRCDQTVPGLNSFACNKTCLLFNVDCSKAESLGLFTASATITVLFKAICEVNGLKLSKCIPQCCLIIMLSLNLLLFNAILSFRKWKMSQGNSGSLEASSEIPDTCCHASFSAPH